MSKSRRWLGLWLGAFMWGISAAAQATLIGVLPTTSGGTDYQAYYDTTTDLTWLANANVNGLMNWSDANAWAAGVGVMGYVGDTQTSVMGWTLPSIADTGTCVLAYSGTDCGYNVLTTSGSTVYSAMASLYFDTLGNLAECDTTGICPQTGGGLNNTGPFTNVVPAFSYWSSTIYDYDPFFALVFGFNGWQGPHPTTGNALAWAVHSGNVGAPAWLNTNSVPEPGTALLMAAGLAGIAARRRSALR